MGTTALERLRDRTRGRLSPPAQPASGVEAVWYPARRSGGDDYERTVVEVLRSAPGVTLREAPLGASGPRALNASLVAGQIIALRPTNPADVRILTLDAALLRRGLARESIVIVHHLDWSMSRHRRALEILTKRLLGRLALARNVVVVSDFWARHLADAGLTNVETIYNAFDVDSYGASDREIEAFRSRHGFGGRPIVYLGKAGKGKGWRKAARALEGLDVALLVTGKSAANRNGGLRCRMFPRDEYRIMLASSSVVVTMSEFDEGWCRVAHEGMLSGTPVIGSGRGGMRELLVGGRQVVCSDFGQLRAQVSRLLNDRAAARSTGEDGRRFAARFDTTRFRKSWLALVGERVALES